MKVNEAENQKKESWFTHQKMYKSYQEIEKTAKTMQSKLKKSVEKARWVVCDVLVEILQAWSFFFSKETTFPVKRLRKDRSLSFIRSAVSFQEFFVESSVQNLPAITTICFFAYRRAKAMKFLS